MKKLSAIITLVLILSLLLCSAASADTITAMASEINPDHLEKVSSYARILGYNEETDTLTVELIVPEVFSGEDIAALQVGDRVYTAGGEIAIESISYNDDWCSTLFINGEDLFLFQDRNGNYTMMADEDDCVWNTMAIVECPVKETLLFLDYVDEETGNALTLPVVHTARDLTRRLLEEDASEVYTVGLTANNVYIVFDEAGRLATIQRYSVPWQ